MVYCLPRYAHAIGRLIAVRHLQDTMRHLRGLPYFSERRASVGAGATRLQIDKPYPSLQSSILSLEFHLRKEFRRPNHRQKLPVAGPVFLFSVVRAPWVVAC